MEIVNYTPFRWYPKIQYPIHAGYVGLKGGFGVSLFGKMIIIIIPINER